MNIQEKIDQHLLHMQTYQSCEQSLKLLVEAEEVIEILKQSLYNVKDYMSIVVKNEKNMSATWNIANNALLESGLEAETDNERK